MEMRDEVAQLRYTQCIIHGLKWLLEILSKQGGEALFSIVLCKNSF